MKTGIIIGNTGTPENPTPEAVSSYLKDFLMDERIVPMNRLLWRYVLNRHILPNRSSLSAERYASIWTPEGSPLVVIQHRLAAKLETRLVEEGFEVAVTSGMSYGKPNMADALQVLKDRGCDSIVLLPLYPQCSYSASYAVSDAFERALKNGDFPGSTFVIRDYFDNTAYLEAIASSIRSAGFPNAADAKVRLIMSYHSVPLKDIKAGDGYKNQCESTSASVGDALGLPSDEVTVAYQSVFGHKKDTWLAPLSKDVLCRLLQEGFDGTVFFVCPGFAIDCLETLDEIPNSIASDYIEAVGEGRFVLVSCLNDSDDQVDALAAVLRPHLPR